MLSDVATETLCLTPRPVAACLDDLLVGATRCEPFRTAETRSGSRFERVWFGEHAFVLKRIELDRDFTMRASGDIGCRPIRAYAAGLFDAAPDLIDHAVVGAARDVGRNRWGGAFLMRDVTAELVPPGDDPFPMEQHLRFLDHLAGMTARTWGWRDVLGLLSYESRWRWFAPDVLEAEKRLGWPEPAPRLAAEGWGRFSRRVGPRLAADIAELRHDVTPLAGALRSSPSCLLHGDWKASNLGTAPDARTVLLDWAYVGEGPPAHELAWYLALNRRKIPAGHTKERVIEEFRTALERHGVDTAGWFERQVVLALLGAVVQFGWEKALGDEAELGWWRDRAREGLTAL